MKKPSAPTETDVYTVQVDGFDVGTPSAIAVSDLTFGKWGANFCGCFENCVPNCWMVTFLPCVSMAQIAARLDVTSYTRALVTFMVWASVECFASVIAYTESVRDDNEIQQSTGTYYWLHHRLYYHPAESSATEADKTGILLYLCITCMVFLLFALAVWHLRSVTRHRFQIAGHCAIDALASCFCSCCVIAQMATHIKSYVPGECTFGPQDTLPAYRI